MGVAARPPECGARAAPGSFPAHEAGQTFRLPAPHPAAQPTGKSGVQRRTCHQAQAPGRSPDMKSQPTGSCDDAAGGSWGTEEQPDSGQKSPGHSRPPTRPRLTCSQRARPFLPIGPPHRVPRGVWDPQLSCHRVTVTCHLLCGLGGRARRRRAIPEPRQHPGPLDPHNAAHPRGRMSPRLGLRPHAAALQPARLPPPPTAVFLRTKQHKGSHGKPVLNKTCFFSKWPRSYPGGSHTGEHRGQACPPPEPELTIPSSHSRSQASGFKQGFKYPPRA